MASSSLFQNILNDPSIEFPSSGDMAERIGALTRLFKRAGLTPGEGADATSPRQQSGSLGRFGLGDPFGGVARPAPRLPMPAPLRPPQAQPYSGPSISDVIDEIGKIGRAQTDDTTAKSDPVNDALTRAAAIINNWSNYAGNQQPQAGAAAPNPGGYTERALAPVGYFSHLRNPEGTAGNYDAVNPTSGAAGPYQFLKGTWGDLMTKHPELGLTWEGFAHPSQFPKQHEAAIRAYTDNSIDAYSKAFGREPSPAELYAMHIFGQSGGMNVLQHQDAPLVSLVGQNVIDANPMLKPYANLPASAAVDYFSKLMG